MMKGKIVQSPKRIRLLVDGLTLYNSIQHKEPVHALLGLCEKLTTPSVDPQDVFSSYHTFTALVMGVKFSDFILDYILKEVNLFSAQAAKNGPGAVNSGLLDLAARDLNILQELSAIRSEDLIREVVKVIGNSEPFGDLEAHDPLNPLNWPRWEWVDNLADQGSSSLNTISVASAWLEDARDSLKQNIQESVHWGNAINALAEYYAKVGFGSFAEAVAFRWQVNSEVGELNKVVHPDPINLKQIIGLQRELNIILENTEHFLSGFRANNMILYGNRGTGKSSIIKALLHEYVDRGLRLVELPKGHLADFQKLLGVLAGIPKKFIVYIDDLSFTEEEADYKSLKSMLEGSLEIRPTNVLVYATSNRRHLITEHFADRQVEELHARDGMEEKLSLADRFGITVTFITPDQEQYLQIVEGLIKEYSVDLDPEQLRKLALQWEMRYNGRSGRTARQFVDYVVAKQNLEFI